jgi:hypothetical protein
MFAEPPPVALLVAALFISMVALLITGHRMGLRRLGLETEQERIGIVSIESAIFGLMGLMLAFTYSGAAQRFEDRRAISIQEANAIGTAYLRIDLLPEAARPALRDKVKRYAQGTLAAYNALPNAAAYTQGLSRARALQGEIWSDAIAALREAPPVASQLVLPPLNEMFDLSTAHEALVRVHTPGAILAALIVLALICSLLAGYGLAGAKAWSRYLHMAGFAFVITGIVYIVVDYDYPRYGFIRIDSVDAALASTLAGMK